MFRDAKLCRADPGRIPICSEAKFKGNEHVPSGPNGEVREFPVTLRCTGTCLAHSETRGTELKSQVLQVFHRKYILKLKRPLKKSFECGGRELLSSDLPAALSLEYEKG